MTNSEHWKPRVARNPKMILLNHEELVTTKAQDGGDAAISTSKSHTYPNKWTSSHLICRFTLFAAPTPTPSSAPLLNIDPAF
jgi:hypothetical protein